MKPLIIYIDDEPRNLTVFEASMPEEWGIKCFDNAIEALKVLKELNPSLIISDQKMPKMTGLEFLEVASQLVPDAIRIVVTGQTEEHLIIQLVRRAKIFDYLTKPWETETLVLQLRKAIQYHQALVQRNRAVEELKIKNEQLEAANAREVELRNEIGAWAPASIVRGIKEKSLQFPVRREIVGITYDIVQSSSLHHLSVQDRTVKSHVLRLFTQSLIRLGGIKESSSGDSVYGHFGAVPFPHNPHVAALMVAQEFRVALRTFSQIHGISVECGIALHHAPDTLIQLHEVRAETPEGPVIQKWFDTTSAQIDLLHRMEKLVHELPGTNIILSEDFLRRIPNPPGKIRQLGPTLLKGQSDPSNLFLLPSDLLSDEDIQKFVSKNFGSGLKVAA
jgi:CheY-like chemotaxis protein